MAQSHSGPPGPVRRWSGCLTNDRSRNGCSAASKAVLDMPSREGLLVRERPEGEGPEVRKRAWPLTRSSPSDCRVATVHGPSAPYAPGGRGDEAERRCHGSG